MTIGIITILAFLTIIFAAYALFTPNTTNQSLKGDNLSSASLNASMRGDIENASDARLSGAIKRGVTEISNLGQVKGMSKEKYVEIQEFIVKSGNPWKLTVEEFQASKFLIALAGTVFGFLMFLMIGADAGIPVWVFVLGGAGLGYMFPKSKYESVQKARAKDLKRSLPEAIDLLVITMNSGQNFEPALAIVVPHLEDGILKTEMSAMNEEIRSGRTVGSALQAFAERASSQGTEDFARSVEQAYKLGSDLTDTLRRQSQRARDDYSAEIDAQISKVSNKIMMALAPTVAPAALLSIAAQQLSVIGTGFM